LPHVVVLAVEDGSSFGTTPVGGGPQEAVSADPWRVLNVATGRQVGLMTMVGLVETAVGRKAEVIMTDALVAEVRENRMDVSLLGRTLGSPRRSRSRRACAGCRLVPVVPGQAGKLSAAAAFFGRSRLSRTGARRP